MSVIWGSDCRRHLEKRRCIAATSALLLVVSFLSVPRAEAQLKDLLRDALGRSREIESVEELVEAGDETVAFFRVRYIDVDDPDEVELSVRALDGSMRSLEGFESGEVRLEASEGEVDVDLAFTGGGEVRSDALEVRLKRRGRTFARRIEPLRRNWGTAGASGGPGDGLDFGEDSPVVEGEAIVLSPVPLGNTPGGSGNSSGGASGNAGGSGGVVQTGPTGGFTADDSTCRRAVQGKIAWNYSGSKSWAATNIDRLCRGATDSEEPARCFDRVMHGGVNWGLGTQWQWKNAIDLCEGSTNATATINCFKARLSDGGGWQKAITSCGK